MRCLSELDILNEIAQRTTNDVILFSVVIIIALVVVMIPLYAITLKTRRAERDAETLRHENEMKEKKLIIDVIAQNSDVMAQIRAMIANNGANLDSGMQRLHDRLNEGNTLLNTHLGEMKGQMYRLEGMMDSKNKGVSM